MTTHATTDTDSVSPSAPSSSPVLGRHRAVRGDSARLEGRLTTLRAAMDNASKEVPSWLADPAREGLDRVEERLELGVDHTVIALLGGTGSGKSSLFNTLSRLQFADVGVRRPTTARAAACTWGDEAEALLDFLGVAPERRIRKESILDSAEETLSGLVLLDVPDYDSVTTENALQVDRLVPVADILVWVLDPQKYADAALHEGYLQGLGARQEDILVLVNQVDTVPEAGVQPLLDDVRSLLAADGLPDVEVVAVSARRGDNMSRLREILRARVSRDSNAARTAEAELEAITSRLRGAVAPHRLDHGSEVDAEASNALVRATGAQAIADSIRVGLAKPVPPSLARPAAPSRTDSEAIRSAWLAASTRGLPKAWGRSIDEVVEAPSLLAERAGQAVAEVVLPQTRRLGTQTAWWGGLLLLAAGLAWLVVAGATSLLSASATSLNGLLLPGLAVLLGTVLAVWAATARRSRASREALRYAAQVREVLDGVVSQAMSRPADNVLRRHEVLQAAVGL